MTSPQTVFGLQFLSSLIVIGLLARWLVAPRLVRLSKRAALFWLTLPHVSRYICMVLLVPGSLSQSFPNYFSAPVIYGALLTSALALLALVLLRIGHKGAIEAVWLFNIIGIVDLLNVLRHVDANFGAAWYVPLILAPLLLMTHYLIFLRLLARSEIRKGFIPE